jgi:hypothetical protein
MTDLERKLKLQVQRLSSQNSRLKKEVTELKSTDIGKLNAKISAISSVFGITFNEDGTLNTESYSSHKHNYEDSTITDTPDGSGTLQTSTKQTSNKI